MEENNIKISEIYLNILSKVVESLCNELKPFSQKTEFDIINELNQSLNRSFESINYLNMFVIACNNYEIDVDIDGYSHKWKPDIVVDTNAGIKFFIETKVVENKHFDSRDLSLRLFSRLELVQKHNIKGGLLLCIDKLKDKIELIPIIETDEIREVSIFQHDINNGKTKIAIFVANTYSLHPEVALDNAIAQYVGYKSYNQFVDIRNDNPWIRIITTGLNSITFEEYNEQKL